MQHRKAPTVEEYRQKRKRKRFLKKIATTVLVLALISLALFVIKIYKDGDVIAGMNTNSEQSNSFPLLIKDEQLMDIFSVNNQLVTLSKSGVKIYDTNGKSKYQFIHGYTNPIFNTNGKNILVYDIGGNKLRVDNTKEHIGEIKTNGSILFAQMSNSGTFAVITRSERYASIVTIYDKKLNVIFEWSSANEQVISLTFSKNNNTFYAATLVSVDGILGSNVYKLNINESKELFKTELKDIVALSLNYKDDDNITVVGKDNATTIDFKGEIKNTFDYNRKILGFDNTLMSSTVIVLENAFDKQTEIVVLDNYGKQKFTKKLDDEVKDVHVSSSRIVLLGKSNVYNLDNSLTELNKIPLELSSSKVKIVDGYAYTMGVDLINKYKLD